MRAQSEVTLEKPWEFSNRVHSLRLRLSAAHGAERAGPAERVVCGLRRGGGCQFRCRCKRAGWPMVVTDTYVSHGHSERTYSSSYLRLMDNDQRSAGACEREGD